MDKIANVRKASTESMSSVPAISPVIASISSITFDVCSTHLEGDFGSHLPSQKGKFTRITDRDISIFEAINRHGPLPVHYLHHMPGVASL